MTGASACQSRSRLQPSTTITYTRRAAPAAALDAAAASRAGRAGSGYTGRRFANRRAASAPSPAAIATAAAVRASDPADGSSARRVAALSAISSFGICSRAFPLVGSELVRTSRQKRRPFVHGAPVRRW